MTSSAMALMCAPPVSGMLNYLSPSSLQLNLWLLIILWRLMMYCKKGARCKTKSRESINQRKVKDE
jgi:hypothetical protein